MPEKEVSSSVMVEDHLLMEAASTARCSWWRYINAITAGAVLGGLLILAGSTYLSCSRGQDSGRGRDRVCRIGRNLGGARRENGKHFGVGGNKNKIK